jgi:hypothetical protein
MPNKEHDRAHDRLDDALSERGESQARFRAAEGTGDELVAASDLQAAERQVAAREAWLGWVDRDDRA